ncbi:MAG: gamma carbonic anhydrase family protein [Elusimicrobia bacterium RIFOXYB2_FULL_49_7]|nr:MAG: gamma carbonic anhydrase family protein [Elusimicrobia bacterium RIFOXYB2_FULL_49_7]
MIKDFNGIKPNISPTAYISDQSLVIGKVYLASGVSLWPGSVLRGDIEEILVGEDTNVQDGAVIHTKHDFPTVIGKAVTIGHRAVIHGCRIGNNCLIGMGAVILDGAIIEDNCLIGAGAIVPENMKIPAGSLALGVPARIKRALNKDELAKIEKSAQEYRKLAVSHRRSP